MAEFEDGRTETELPEDAATNGNAVRSHLINQEIISIIKYRQARKWLITAALIASQMTIIASMLYCLAASVKIDSEAKEVLLLIIGGLSVSMGKAVDFWFSGSEDDEKYLQSAQQDDWGA